MAEKHTGFEAIDVPITLGTGAKINRHVDLNAPSFEKPAANYPGSTFEGIFATRDFDKTTQQSMYFTINIPHRWKSASDIVAHIFWVHDTNAADAAKFVRWGLEYKAIKAGEAVTGAGTSITKDQASLNATEGKLINTIFTTKILGSNLETHDQLAIRVYRDAANDDLNMDARIIMVHLEFQMDKLGEVI